MTKEVGKIRYANLETSERLQRLLAFMKGGGQHTTLEIILGAEIAAVNSAIDELRHNGYHITCRRLDRSRWAYTLHWCPKCSGYEIEQALFGPACKKCGSLVAIPEAS